MIAIAEKIIYLMHLKHIWIKYRSVKNDNIIDLDFSVKKNIKNLAEFK